MRTAGTLTTGMLTQGVTTPTGTVLEVPLFPRHRVELGEDTATVDGTEVPVAAGQDPRAAATANLVAKARRMRGPSGAVRVEVITTGSTTVWHAVVTANGELFDATSHDAGTTGGRWALLAAGVAAVVVLAATTAVVLTSRPAPATVAAAPPAPPPSGTPTPYPQLPPPGFAGVADWSAPIAPGAVPVLTDNAVLVVTGSTGAPSVTALDPSTGRPTWSVPLPRGATTGGLHLAVIDGAPMVATSTGTDLLWWPLTAAADGTHPRGGVALPAQSVVSWAGTTPLVDLPGQHAAAVTDGRLVDRAVPAGATALGAATDPDGTVVVVAANSLGQLWRLRPGTTIPTPTQVTTPTGAAALEAVAGYTAPLDSTAATTAGKAPEVVVTTWFTTDPATRLVALVDATTGAVVGTPIRAAAADLASSGWAPSPRHRLGTLGPVLARTTPGSSPTGAHGLVSLPLGWRSTEVTDSAVYGTATTTGTAPTRLLISPNGEKTDLGSGSVPLGVVAGRAVVAATVGATSTLYGLPAATTAPSPTPSVTASAPPALPSAAPTPAKAAPPTRAP